MTRPADIHSTRTLDENGVAEVRSLVERVATHDGVAPLNEAALLILRDAAADPAYVHVRALSHDGGTVGYLLADPSRPPGVKGELAVDPAVRRRGVGTALLEEIVDHGVSSGLQVWAHGDRPGARELAQRFGLGAVRTLLELGADLPAEAPEPEVPAGVRIRTFVPGEDDEAWLAANARAFASHPEQGSLTLRELRQRIATQWFDPAGFFLAERDGRIVGFHWTKVEGDTGEVYVLGVDPDAQGLGLGSVLTQTGLSHLSSRGLRRVTLYVEADNAAARALYAKLGFTEVARDVLYGRP